MINLRDEFSAAVGRSTDADWEALQDAGMPSRALDRLPLPGVFGVGHVRPVGKRLYEPLDIADQSISAAKVFIVPTNLIGTFHSAEIEDLLALDLAGRWRLRLGEAVFLGQHELERRILGTTWTWHTAVLDGFAHDPLRIHRTPLDWLRAECDGCVVLDWRAAVTDLLSLETPILAADYAHGEDIRRRLTNPVSAPEIRIPVERRAA